MTLSFVLLPQLYVDPICIFIREPCLLPKITGSGPIGLMTQKFERNINLKMGQAPVIHYMPELFRKITAGEFDPTKIISHRIALENASDTYRVFNDHEDECTKAILKP